ncbi:MAG: ABC transporter ATP-binding protein [Propionibacteriaceae bacterium]
MTSNDSDLDLLATSAATWDDRRSEEAVLPSQLIAPFTGSVGERLAAWRQRHLLRTRRAEDFYAASRNPEQGLPVAGNPAVLEFLGNLVRTRRGRIAGMLVLNALAAVAGLFAPRLLGDLVNSTAEGVAVLKTVNALALTVIGFVLLQGLMTLLAKWVSSVVGQDVLAAARESVVRSVLALPLGRVESASSGDLVTRITRDVGTMSESVRYGLPQAIISGLTVLLTFAALVINSWLLALPTLVLVGLSMIQVRRYLQRAPKGYITEGGTYSRINTTLTETVEGARTVEALRLSDIRRRRGDGDIAVSSQAERYTMTLRNLLFAVIDSAFSLPRALTIVVGALGYAYGWVTLGQITAGVLYLEALIGPLDALISNVDRLQVGIASTTRLLGIAAVQPDRLAGDELPAGRRLVGTDLRFAYREGHDVLHGIDLDLRTGERLAIVGPSGSGKSTLGRLMSGIHAPRTGTVQVGGVELVALPLSVLRTEVALVTQEHHVFVGTVRDNIVLAREDSATDDQVWAALHAVDAYWVERLPERLDTLLASGNTPLTPAQAQQVALARLIIADPHTLVLDEATSLIDPRTARHLEGSMSALLSGRTVIAIAHRLHTAHDADRIAVVIEGRVVELGSHDELVEADGEYAALWRAWTSS